MAKIEIGKIVETGEPFTIDLKTLLKSRLLVQANSGGGKTYLIRKIIEETHGKVQQIVLDIEDDFSTLREKCDFILAGSGGDISVNLQTAEIFAHKILELGADVIINLYELKPADRIRYVKLFLQAMVDAPKALWHPCIVVLDEAQIFAPEKTKSESIGAVIDLAARGRKRGFCIIPATQRPAKLDKDVAAECRNKLVGLANIKIDRKCAAEELGLTDRDEIMSLRDLEEGQFYAVGPSFPRGLTKIQVSKVKTTHHEAGEVSSKHAKPVATGKIQKILAKLTDLPKEAEDDLRDKESMKKRIRDLEHELRTAKQAVKVETKIEKVVDPKAIKQAQDDFKEEFMKEFERADEILKAAFADFRSATKKTFAIARENAHKKYAHHPVQVAFVDAAHRDVPIKMSFRGKSINPSSPFAIEKVREMSRAISHGDRSFGRCERSILKFLAMREGVAFSRVQVGALTGYSPTSGGFNNSISILAQAGIISRMGDKVVLPKANVVHAREILGEEYLAPEPDALLGWLSKLPKCERQVFEFLKNHNRAVQKDQLAQQTGYSATSGGFNNSISKLSTLGLVQRNSDGSVEINREIIGI